jgi:hypothetical protein
MTPSELYSLWAPEDSIWSNWAKPMLFSVERFIGGEPNQATQWQSLNVAWSPTDVRSTAIVLDLPGADAIWYGIAMAQHGFRPVPLYNGVPGSSALIDVNSIVVALHEVEQPLTELLSRLPADAPPVFLLDSNRSAGGTIPSPGRFDNRWWVFPQDFPSANLVLSRGIDTVILAQAQAGPPQTDLAHVLLRWQEAGLRMFAKGVDDVAPPAVIQVQRPARFGWLWYRALVLAGLRRNSAGGFGAIVPIPGSGGGYG